MSVTKIVALTVGFGLSLSAASILLFLLFRKNEEEQYYDDFERTRTSRQAVAHVHVPKCAVGSVIGRQGENIKDIQRTTKTRINFNDPGDEDEDRIATIRGNPEEVQEAENLILKAIRDHQLIETYEMFVPQKVCGRLIGRNGDSIRHMCEVSKAKIAVEKSSCRTNPNSLRRITIRGTSSQIDVARGLVDEILYEEEAYHQKSLRNPVYHPQEAAAIIPDEEKKPFLSITSQADETEPYGKEVARTEHLVPTGSDGFLEVMMSAVNNPGYFWVQLVGGRSRELDKLVEELTDYCKQPNNRQAHELEEVAVGDIVAAPFQHDDLWYRAKVTAVEEDCYNPKERKLSIYYVDFGDSEEVTLQDVCGLEKAFLRLPFQAIGCALAKVAPRGGAWSEEASLLFEQLTYAAQWKVIMARPIAREEGGDTLPAVDLVDTSGSIDVNVAAELVTQGYAVWVEE